MQLDPKQLPDTDQCRRMREMMGGVEWSRGEWVGSHLLPPGYEGKEWCIETNGVLHDTISGTEAACIIITAAEQVVRGTPHFPIPFCGDRWLVVATDYENGGEQNDELYDTYLKALEGGLRKAMAKETRKHNAGNPAERSDNA